MIVNIKDITDDGWSSINLICRYSTPEMIKYIIDIYLENNFDIECSDAIGWRSIHFICRYSTPEMIKYIIDLYLEKGLSLKCMVGTGNNYGLIYLIRKYSTPEMLSYISDLLNVE